MEKQLLYQLLDLNWHITLSRFLLNTNFQSIHWYHSYLYHSRSILKSWKIPKNYWCRSNSTWGKTASYWMQWVLATKKKKFCHFSSLIVPNPAANSEKSLQQIHRRMHWIFWTQTVTQTIDFKPNKKCFKVFTNAGFIIKF